MDKLPLDILKIIFDLLDFKSKIKLISTCTYMRQNLYIIDLYDIGIEYSKKLTTKILKYNIFKNVVSLNVSYNNKIKDVSFMNNLKYLNASMYSKVNQNGIKGLDLIELNINNNKNIVNVTFMKGLKILHATSNCGIKQSGIKGLDLTELDVDYNIEIKNVSIYRNKT